MSSITFGIVLTDTARNQLAALRDRVAQQAIAGKIDLLKYDPQNRGKALRGELAGYRSMPGGGRYRIIFKVEELHGRVLVNCLGIRKDGDKKDVYELARKLLEAGELDSF